MNPSCGLFLKDHLPCSVYTALCCRLARPNRMTQTRADVEREILVAELRAAEASTKPPRPREQRVAVVGATFSLGEGAPPLGLHLDDKNVICRISPDGVAATEGTMRVGDHIVAVNSTSTEGRSVMDILRTAPQQVTLVAARRVSDEGVQKKEGASGATPASKGPREVVLLLPAAGGAPAACMGHTPTGEGAAPSASAETTPTTTTPAPSSGPSSSKSNGLLQLFTKRTKAPPTCRSYLGK